MPRREHQGAAHLIAATGHTLSPDAFAAEYQSAWRRLWCIAASVLGDRAAVDDVLQEAAIIGLRKIEDFEPGTSFTAWMGRIVRNVALNEGRRKLRSRVVSVEPATLAGAADDAGQARDAEVAMAADAFDGRVLEALNRLSEVARTCLLLRTLHDMSYAEIAHVTGVPEGTAMSHVHRARKEMREKLAAHFGGGGNGESDSGDDR